MPILAYFDQTHIGRFTEPQLDRLVELVDAGLLLAPMSMVHYIETLKHAQAARGETLDRLARLSSGFGLPHEGEVMLLEWMEARGLGEPVDTLLRQPETWSTFGFHSAAKNIRVFEQVPDEALTEHRAQMETVLAEAAASHESSRHKSLNEVLPSMAEALQFMTGGQISASEVLRVVPAREEDVAAVFRTVGARRSIYRKMGFMEPNDVMDLAFICTCLPYFDLVGVDRAMNKTLGRARRNETLRIRDAVHRAKVAYRPDQILREIETLVEQQHS